MADHYVDIRVYFDRVTDEDEPTYHEYARAEVRGTLTDSEWDSVTERWAQSDRYWTKYTSDFLNAPYSQRRRTPNIDTTILEENNG